MSSKLYQNAVMAELRRWLIQSQKLRRSAALAYGKIRANLTQLEPIATKEEMDKLQDDAGKFIALFENRQILMAMNFRSDA